MVKLRDIAFSLKWSKNLCKQFIATINFRLRHSPFKNAQSLIVRPRQSFKFHLSDMHSFKNCDAHFLIQVKRVSAEDVELLLISLNKCFSNILHKAFKRSKTDLLLFWTYTLFHVKPGFYIVVSGLSRSLLNLKFRQKPWTTIWKHE